jgi:hypothetical protein
MRRLATRQGYRYQHAQAIIVAIDQYAEAATGNRDFFLDNARCGRHTVKFGSMSDRRVLLGQRSALTATEWLQ